MLEKILSKVNKRDIVAGLVIIVLAVLTAFGINVTVDQIVVDNNLENKIVLSDEAKPALIDGLDETSEGLSNLETIEVPTIEEVDSELPPNECPENEDCGRGWYVDVTTPDTYMDATIGQCVDTDGAYGSQCWDLANLFWQNYAGRSFSTCGTGAAKGTLNCADYNAGTEFDMVWDKSQIRKGDWVIFTNGTWGHVGMALGPVYNGYVALFGTNQGGKPCNGGGSAANIVNINAANIGGAFRPNGWNWLFVPAVDDDGEPVIDGKG